MLREVRVQVGLRTPSKVVLSCTPYAGMHGRLLCGLRRDASVVCRPHLTSQPLSPLRDEITPLPLGAGSWDPSISSHQDPRLPACPARQQPRRELFKTLRLPSSIPLTSSPSCLILKSLTSLSS